MSAEPLPTPYVAVDRQRLLANIERMAAHASDLGVKLRPHAKTHKSPAIARRQVQAGATGLSVATMGEAEAFAAYGFDDLFIAYPLWLDEDRAHRLHHLLHGATVRIGVDSVEAVAQLAPAAADNLSLLVEVDCGHRRSGADPAEAGRIAAAAEQVGLRVAGVFTFPGQAYAAGAGAKAAADEASALATAAQSLREAGVEPIVISGGSTPSAAHVKPGLLTELRPGVYVFGDAQQWALGSCTPDQIALTVTATVVSHTGGRLVLDCGSKVLGSDRPEFVQGYGRLLAHPEARIVQLSEHHAVVDFPGPLPPRGSRLSVVPNHVCVAVNCVDRLFVVDDGLPSDNWPVAARGAIT